MAEPAVAPVELEKAVITAPDEPKVAPPVTSAEVTVGGVKYTVTPELAKSLQEAEDVHIKERQALEDRTPVAPPPAVVVEPVATELGYTKIGDRIFEDPDGVMNQFKNEVIADVSKMYNDAEAEKKKTLDGQLVVDNFYDEFFKENKELKKHEPLVKTIMNTNWQKWGHLSEKQMQERLAKEAQDIIMPNMVKEPTPELGVVLESGGQVVEGTPPAKKDDGEGYTSMSQVIRSRQKARKEAGEFVTPPKK